LNIEEKYNRTCIVCKKRSSKYGFIRFVKSKKYVLLDLKMVLDGRGAYICKNNTCVLQTVAKKRLCYSLKVNINDINWDELLLDVNSVI
tara:strand:+ start:227 stop:493 length:267 start_codon:yes stop_codon:yes gene_type:complete